MISEIDHRQARIRDSIRIDANGCWIWMKSKSWNGYGRYATGGGGNARAHRVSYAAFVGTIPPDMDVCHKCDVRACVNPDHLFVGTRSENIKDAVAKGRIDRDHKRKGSAHPSSKLTEDDVDEIVALLKSGLIKSDIARRFGVSWTVIKLISQGKSWGHLKSVADLRKTQPIILVEAA